MVRTNSNPVYFENNERAKRLDLQTCVLQYQTSKNGNLLEIILYQLKNVMNYFVYHKTNYHDKAELMALCEDKLLACLESYDGGYGVKFVTYYSTSLANAIATLAGKQKGANQLSLDYNYTDDEESKDMLSFLGADESGYEDVETETMMEGLKQFLKSTSSKSKCPNNKYAPWEAEFKVCQIIMREPHKLSNAEIARELGLTTAAIPVIIERIKNKFNQKFPNKKLQFTL
jgi:hypothetical protein